MALDPLTGVLELGSKVIDKIWPDKEKADQAKLELIRLQQAGELKDLEMRFQAVIAEAQSSDKWTSRARPGFLYVMYAFMLASIPLGILAVFQPTAADTISRFIHGWLSGMPDEVWWLFGSGYLGYSGFRTLDKRK